MRIFCISLGTALIACAATNNPPRWHTQIAEAFAEARRAHKPVLAVLHCPH